MPAITRPSDAASVGPDAPFLETEALNPTALVSSSQHEMNQAWSQRTDDLLSIRRLKDDWDGLGARAPDAQLVDSAIDLLKLLMYQDQLPPPHRIVATPTGTLLLEWQMGPIYLESEITSPYHAEWMLEHPGGRTEHEATSWPPPGRAADSPESSSVPSETHYPICGEVAVSDQVAA